MIKVKWKNVDKLEKKLVKIMKRLPETATQGINEALKSTQQLALTLKRGSNKGVLIELVDTKSNEIKGRVYTDSKNYPYLTYLEFGTGLYADPEGGGSRAKKIPWYVHESMADLSKYNYQTIQTEQGKFYIVYGMHPYPYMRPAAFQNRDTNVELVEKEISQMIGEVVR